MTSRFLVHRKEFHPALQVRPRCLPLVLPFVAIFRPTHAISGMVLGIDRAIPVGVHAEALGALHADHGDRLQLGTGLVV